MKSNQWLKYGLAIIFILLVSVFPLSRFLYNPKPFIVEKKKDEIIVLPQEKLPEKKITIATKPRTKEKVPEIQLVLDTILLSKAGFDINLAELDTNKINEEIQLLAASIRMEELKIVKHFYIPRVEYDIDLKKLILPSCLILAGGIASSNDKFRDFIHIPRPNGKPTQHRYDDILQYVVPPSLFVLDAFGKEKHNPIDQALIMGIAGGLTTLPVRNLKKFLKEPRPDGGTNSFPSGHTAVAVVGAHMIYKEFKDSNPWFAYSGYVMAGAVGAGRIINNRHWLCDVVAGAGFAILSTELAYIIYFPIRNAIADGANKLFGNYYLVTPVFHSDGMELKVSITF